MAPSAAVALADAAAEEGAAPARVASPTGRLSGFAKAMLALLAGAILVLDFLFIPFHAADDEEHFPLAYAAAHFHLGPVPAPDPRISSGTFVDAAIPVVIARNWHAVRLGVKPVSGHTPFTGREVFHPLPASAYVPLVYLPQMAGIRITEALGGTVEQAILAARLANGLTALALIGVALATLPSFWLALALYGCGTLLWIWILQTVPLSRAYPFTALGFVFVPVIAAVFFAERLNLTYALGAALIIAGIFVTVKA